MPADTTQQTGTAAAGELQTLFVVSGAHLISHLHIMVLPVLLPLLKDHMQVGFFELGLALTVFNIVSGLTQAPMGFLVDRIGARTVLVAGLLLGGFAFVSLGVLNFYAWLIGAGPFKESGLSRRQWRGCDPRGSSRGPRAPVGRGRG